MSARQEVDADCPLCAGGTAILHGMRVYECRSCGYEWPASPITPTSITEERDA